MYTAWCCCLIENQTTTPWSARIRFAYIFPQSGAAFALHARFPDAKGTAKAAWLVWTGLLQPAPFSGGY